jgi:hypothetical protein
MRLEFGSLRGIVSTTSACTAVHTLQSCTLYCMLCAVHTWIQDAVVHHWNHMLATAAPTSRSPKGNVHHQLIVILIVVPGVFCCCCCCCCCCC